MVHWIRQLGLQLGRNLQRFHCQWPRRDISMNWLVDPVELRVRSETWVLAQVSNQFSLVTRGFRHEFRQLKLLLLRICMRGLGHLGPSLCPFNLPWLLWFTKKRTKRKKIKKRKKKKKKKEKENKERHPISNQGSNNSWRCKWLTELIC